MHEENRYSESSRYSQKVWLNIESYLVTYWFTYLLICYLQYIYKYNITSYIDVYWIEREQLVFWFQNISKF